MNLINKIDSFLVKKEKRERFSYYPSEVSKCMRQLWYKWKNTKESNPISPGAFWKMRMGDKIHELIFEFLEDAGLEIINEISFKHDAGLKYPISGRIDNIFIDEDGMMSGIEIKSSYGAGIRNLKKTGPKQQDLEQIITYMGCTDIKRFYLIYIARDDGYRTQFVVNHDKELFNKLIEKFKKLENYVDENNLPDREYNVVIKAGEIKDKIQKDKKTYVSNWQCKYCQYKDYCWQNIKQVSKDSGLIFNGESQL